MVTRSLLAGAYLLFEQPGFSKIDANRYINIVQSPVNRISYFIFFYVMFKIKKIELLLNIDNLEATMAIKNLVSYTRRWHVLFILVFFEFIISTLAKTVIELREVQAIKGSQIPWRRIALVVLVTTNSAIFLTFAYFLVYFQRMIIFFINQLGHDGILTRTKLWRNCFRIFNLLLLLSFLNSFVIFSLNELIEYWN